MGTKGSKKRKAQRQAEIAQKREEGKIPRHGKGGEGIVWQDKGSSNKGRRR